MEEAFMLLLKKIVDSGMVDTLQNGQRGQQLRGASGVDNGRQKKSCC